MLFAGDVMQITLLAIYLVSSAAEVATAAKSAKPGDIFHPCTTKLTFDCCNIISMTGSQWTSQNIYLTVNGTDSQPIYLRGNGVKITGTSKLHLGGSYIIEEGLYFADG